MGTSRLVLGHSNTLGEHPLCQVLGQCPVSLQVVDDPQALPAELALLLLDETLLALRPLEYWLESGAILLGCLDQSGVLPLPARASVEELSALLRFAGEQHSLRHKTAQLTAALAGKHDDLSKLVDVGLALSAERDLDRLLEKILIEGRRLSNSDAASLFLIGRRPDAPPQLIFKLTQNGTLSQNSFQDQRMPLSKASIAGYVALTSTELNLEDVYAIAADAPYRFNRSFDLQMGYRTLSILAIPMLNHRHEVVGVLEFINRQRKGCDAFNPELIAFDEEIAVSLRALASQAAVAIENRQLLDDISRLFDGFVKASVFAIERRDPTTSGHSFRVAELCLALANQLPQAPSDKLRAQALSSDGLRELRYAALLHDFGKVGVREHVLVKAKKLAEPVLENLRYRVALAQENLRNQTLRKMLHAYRHQAGLSEERRLQLEAELAYECERLERYLNNIVQANEPSMLSEGDFQHLQEVQGELVKAPGNCLISLLSEGEFGALAIRKGSLTTAEREEIERHVVHTQEFLSLIPWTPDLQGVPHIAGAHHEKLDGSGYPKGLVGDAIPCASRIMTVCDIYDALTAADRPYKPAMPLDRALDILKSEAQSGLLDAELVQLFIASRCFQVTGAPGSHGASPFSHHVCDYEPSCTREQPHTH
ncbi:HD domain-containing phosphohydrolase [Pseudomonas sp.]|uniref:HD domain-containing phosphohydrolase n=1 Tax=Pseudomonas sp. TaxID=306 RepID=UPI003C772CFC